MYTFCVMPAAPLLSLTDVVIDTFPETVTPLAGLVIANEGGAVSADALLATFTLTGADTVEFPAASKAAAVRDAVPSDTVVVFHEN